MRSQGALGVDGGRGCVARTGKRVEERIALRVDLRPAVLAERGPDDAPMIGGDGGICGVAKLLQEPCRALDVGEGKRDGSGGEVCHRLTLAT